MTQDPQDRQNSPLSRLLTEAAQGGQAKVDALIALMQRTVESREDGRNVYFTGLGGEPDRRSFSTIERADAFRAKLIREGREVTK